MAEQKKIRVMVAEDMEILREDFCDTINRQEDMEMVGNASTGREILELVKKTPCDVILMDVEMESTMAGIWAAEQIMKENPEMKIIFLTVHETDEMITSAMSTGAVDYVVKGCEDEVLIEHIRNAYNNQIKLDPHIRQTVMQEYTRLRQSEKSLLFFINNVARLTPAERQLIKLLLEGKKVQEISKIRCVEVVTVKTQIKGLLNKFGCSRSKEIVQLIRQLGLEYLFQGK